MKRALPTRLLLATAIAVGVAIPPALAFDAGETGEIETIIRDYLIRNPEVLVEALNALEAKRAEEAEAAQKQALAAAGPELFASPEGTILGNPDGDVTVVEFFDYNCGYCRRALADKATLLSADPQLRFVLKEIPVLGPPSEAATRVSLAVRNAAPESYAEFHNRLLGSRGVADEARAFQIVQEMGLDADGVRRAMGSPEVATALQEATRLANLLQIDGTPSYVVGDEVVAGAVGADLLGEKIANVRECGSATC